MKKALMMGMALTLCVAGSAFAANGDSYPPQHPQNPQHRPHRPPPTPNCTVESISGHRITLTCERTDRFKVGEKVRLRSGKPPKPPKGMPPPHRDGRMMPPPDRMPPADMQ